MKTNDSILIFWMCANKIEAKKILTALFKRKTIACANIFSGVESMFFWEGKVQTEKECFVLIKTRKSNFEKVKQAIKNQSSYDVPEILKVAIDDALDSYLAWIHQVTES